MTKNRNGGPSGSPERLVVVVWVLTRDGWRKAPKQPRRQLAEWMRMRAEPESLAYVCRLYIPDGWGVCFVRPDGDVLKEYPDQDTAKAAAMVGSS